MKVEVTYFRINPNGIECTNTETVDTGGELYHKLDQDVLTRKVREKLEMLHNEKSRFSDQEVGEIVSVKA